MRRLPRFISTRILALGSILALSSVAQAQEAGEEEAPQTTEAQPEEQAPAPSESEPPAPPEAAPVEREDLLPPEVPPPALSPPTTTPVTPSEQQPMGGEDIAPAAPPSEVFAEDWWTHARPVLELHGYLRLRAELFHNFSLGRVDVPSAAFWPQPSDNSYIDQAGGMHEIKLCGDVDSLTNCKAKMQASANMRLRFNPEIHISDNLRIMSQVDMLDNLVLGSTPEGTYNQPGAGGGYEAVAHGGYVPRGAFATTQIPPTSGINSFKNSIEVKRAWGEYMTPVGQLRFGRMPSHWGLGMVANSGDSYDSDWQSTSDRIMFLTGIRSLDLYFGGAWDFLNVGPTSATVDSVTGGQPYDMARADDASQYVLIVMRRRNPQLAKMDLARGDVVLNGGVYFVYRNQTLANDTAGAGQASLGASSADVQTGYVRRGAEAFIPDAWVQLLYRKFRFEAEVATIQGTIDNTNTAPGSMEAAKLRQWGVTTQTELKAVEDRLRMQFGFGWASGDANLSPNEANQSLVPPKRGLQPHVAGPNTFSEFRFHPDYRVDLILFRHILQRVQGAYYFRPSMEYDFSRNPNGQRFGGGAAIIWSRASEFVQTPGHKRDLGVEIDLSLYFQSKDGTLNDDPDKMGGFFTMLQYGVLFPLGGLGYLPGEQALAPAGVKLDTSAAHTLRWYMGIFY